MVKTCGKCDYFIRDLNGVSWLGVCDYYLSSCYGHYLYSVSTYPECPIWDVV